MYENECNERCMVGALYKAIFDKVVFEYPKEEAEKILNHAIATLEKYIITSEVFEELPRYLDGALIISGFSLVIEWNDILCKDKAEAVSVLRTCAALLNAKGQQNDHNQRHSEENKCIEVNG